jgi:hypothetical protein
MKKRSTGSTRRAGGGLLGPPPAAKVTLLQVLTQSQVEEFLDTVSRSGNRFNP